MKNKVLLIGGSLFTTMKYNENEFVPIYNSFVNKLNLMYDVYNMSVEEKDSDFYYSLLSKLLVNDNNYKKAFLYIGEKEAHEYNLDIDKFCNTYASIIKLLLQNHISVELYLIEDKYNNNIKINNVIKKLSKDYNVNLNGNLIRENLVNLSFFQKLV